MLHGRTIILGVTGGIAAYKSASLASRLVQLGADVRVVMTTSAVKFITPLTFQAIVRSRVIVDTFDEAEPSVISHIDLADRADAIVVAPATANAIAKFALGLGDDMLSTILLASRAPVFVAPAMNVHMYNNAIVQSHMQTLGQRGYTFVEPGEGFLACGYTGKGRMAEPEQIVNVITDKLSILRDLEGLGVLVTAGRTVERIDPVRFLSNDSSGKMGIAIAMAARDRGAKVTLIAGRTDVKLPDGVTIVHAFSAQEMHDAVFAHYDDVHIAVKTAAVADYRPVRTESQKIKKTDERLMIELERTPDILREMGNRKNSQVLVGFAAETQELERNAINKAISKKCDFIIANDVSLPGAGFSTDTNIVSIYRQEGLLETMPLQSKRAIAERILTLAYEKYRLTMDERNDLR